MGEQVEQTFTERSEREVSERKICPRWSWEGNTSVKWVQDFSCFYPNALKANKEPTSDWGGYDETLYINTAFCYFPVLDLSPLPLIHLGYWPSVLDPGTLWMGTWRREGDSNSSYFLSRADHTSYIRTLGSQEAFNEFIQTDNFFFFKYIY